MNLPAIPTWPVAFHLEAVQHDQVPDIHSRWYGVRARRCALRHLAPCPTELSVQRFLVQPPSPEPVPVPVPEDLPFDPAAYATAYRALSLMLEVLDRRRPLLQLRPMLTPQAFRYLGVVVDWLPTTAQRGNARVLSIRMCQPRDDVAEIAAVCKLGGRIRAMAARFERHQEPVSVDLRWRCSVIHLG